MTDQRERLAEEGELTWPAAATADVRHLTVVILTPRQVISNPPSRHAPRLSAKFSSRLCFFLTPARLRVRDILNIFPRTQAVAAWLAMADTRHTGPRYTRVRMENDEELVPNNRSRDNTPQHVIMRVSGHYRSPFRSPAAAPQQAPHIFLKTPLSLPLPSINTASGSPRALQGTPSPPQVRSGTAC